MSDPVQPPPGEVESIRDVALTDAGDGTVAVLVDLAAELRDDGSWVVLGIETGTVDGGTAGAARFDYVLLLTHEGAAFGKWDGADYGAFDHQPLAPKRDGGRVGVTLTLVDLGVEAFRVWVASNSAGVVDSRAVTYPAPPTSGARSRPYGPGSAVRYSALVDADDLRRLEEVGTETEVPAGHVLIERGQHGAGLYVVLDGTVLIEAPEGERELGPGSVIGERALMSADGTRTARARSTTPLRVVAVDRAAYDRLCADDPTLAERLALRG